MKTSAIRPAALAVVLIAGFELSAAICTPAFAANKAELDRESRQALDHLVATVPAAKEHDAKAAAVLVFPSITKAVAALGTAEGFEVGVGPITCRMTSTPMFSASRG